MATNSATTVQRPGAAARQPAAADMPQYSLGKVLAIWTVTGLPMALLAWVAAPAIIWWLMGVAFVSCVFNYFLGETQLWHGVLLPKLQGVFGKADWAVNAVLFGFYHLHKPWMLPSIIVTNMANSWPARRYRSVWMAVIVHGVEGIPALVMSVLVILGLFPG